MQRLGAATVLDVPQTSSVANLLLRGKLNATDTTNIFQIDAEGDISWGVGGSTALDTSLTHFSANQLFLSSILGVNASFNFIVQNNHSSAAAQASVILESDTAQISLAATSTLFTPSGLLKSQQAEIYGFGTGGMLIAQTDAADIVFGTGGVAASNENLRIQNSTGLLLLQGLGLPVNPAVALYSNSNFC